MKNLHLASLSILLVLGLAAGAAAQENTSCPSYGCAAALIPLSSGGLVLHGDTTVPTSWHNRAPAHLVHVTRAATGEEQVMRIHWVRRDYFCCCPSDWHGEFADVLRLPVLPGELLVVRIGDGGCTTTIMVPEARLHGPAVHIDPSGAPATGN